MRVARRTRRNLAAFAISAVCALSLGAGGSVAMAAPMEAHGSVARAACTVGTSTIAECFPDAVLAATIAAATGLSVSDMPTQLQLEGITEVIANDGVGSLEGLQLLHNLNSLAARNGTIDDLSPLSGLTKLKLLSITNNRVSDLSPLAAATKLELLNAGQNPLRDASMLPSATLIYAEGALAESPEYPFTRGAV